MQRWVIVHIRRSAATADMAKVRSCGGRCPGLANRLGRPAQTQHVYKQIAGLSSLQCFSQNLRLTRKRTDVELCSEMASVQFVALVACLVGWLALANAAGKTAPQHALKTAWKRETSKGKCSCSTECCSAPAVDRRRGLQVHWAPQHPWKRLPLWSEG